MNGYHSTSSSFTNYAALLLRLTLGALWLSHGLLKLTAFAVPEFAAALAAQGMPTPLGWPVMLIELAGGVLIILGIHGRVVSLALLPMLAGVLLAHVGNGWVDSPAGGWGYPAVLMMLTLVHVRVGDGAGALYARAASRRVSAAPAYTC